MDGGLTITNAVVVLPDRVLDRATVAVDAGRIAVVEEGPVSSATGRAETVDAAGAYLIPGVVDLHNDNLEFEINPRSNANLPLPFALGTMERRLAGAGVTTEFHAISFQENLGKGRSITNAEEKAAFIAGLDDSPRRAVRHHILHRLDVRTPHALDSALPSLRRVRVPYVSLNDHTPGQGQYRDVDRLVKVAQANLSARNEAAADPEWYRERMRVNLADIEAVPAFYRRVRDVATDVPMVVSTHDDDTVAKVDEQLAIGATVAEFPITFEAARHARAHGMHIVVGAPNIVRGGSQSGNLAAADLIADGLADSICADYHAPCLLPAAFMVADQGLRDLPAAVGMVTRAPALAVGLGDRGAILPGLLADLALVRRDADGWPYVERTWVEGREVFRFGTSAARRDGESVSRQDGKESAR